MSSKPDPFESTVAEAPPVASAAVVPKAARVELGGDEVIEFSIKPALWFIPLESARWVLTACVLAVALAVAQQTGWTREGAIAFTIIIAVAVLRVGVAALQWASKLYVLTNRRVMRFRGVLTVEVAECPLSKIGRADLHVDWYQRPLRLGSIRMEAAAEPKRQQVVWEHLAHPAEIHERVRRAIRRSQSNGPAA